MQFTLMHPPLDDPTLPYHSTAYLAGSLKSNGFGDVVLRDINIEFVNYCLRRDTVNAFYNEAERRLGQFEARSELNAFEQEQFLELWAGRRIETDRLENAVRQMRDRDLFLDYSSYLDNVRLFNRYFWLLGVLSYPSAIVNFRQVTLGNFSIYNLADLFNYKLLDDVSYPFARFFYEHLTNDPQLDSTDCFGISVVYDHQLTHAVWLSRALKKRWPEKLVLLGGTAISQYYKYLKDKGHMKHFFKHCDAIVVGEGETAICQIAELQGNLSSGAHIRNTITYDRTKDELLLPERICYESLPTLGTPVYDYPWHLYLSPERGVNYSPTRGCYWNRCTFCDYGLNTDMPTSPWRERKIDQVIADLEDARQRHGVQYVYFAVDVMSPTYLEKLSDAMLDAHLEVRWSAELRMEKVFSVERCEKMARAGCKCISFGMESGNQRVLDLIDKGTKVQYMSDTMRNFSRAGIAVQLMAFHGFPTETEAERSATMEFIADNKGYWSGGGFGAFLLTGTAIVAKNPEKFGIKLVETADVDSVRALAYQVGEETDRVTLSVEDADASFDSDGNIFPITMGRPWAGGIDSLHSMIYYEVFGQTFFKRFPVPFHVVSQEEITTELLDRPIQLRGMLARSALDISRMLANRKAHREHTKSLTKRHVEPTYAAFVKWAETTPAVQQDQESFWISTETKCMKLDHTAYLFLDSASRQLSVTNLLRDAEPDLRERLLEYLKQLRGGGLVVFLEKDGASPKPDCAEAIDFSIS